MSDTLGAISAIGTLLIAIATLLIAWRQTQLSETQTKFAEQQTGHDLAQLHLAEQLATLQRWSSTPKLVPSEVQFNAEKLTLSFVLENAGGGAAVDVWLESICVLEGKASGMQSIQISQRIDVVRDSAIVIVDLIENIFPHGVEKLLAFVGTAVFPDGPRDIEYETIEGMAARLWTSWDAHKRVFSPDPLRPSTD